MTQSGPDAPDYLQVRLVTSPEGDMTQALPNPAVRQHPRVDPTLEIGGGAELGTVGASKSPYHLAENSEGHALSGPIPNHGLLRRQGPEARRELLPPGDDGLALPKATRLRPRSFSMQRRPKVGGIGREGEADRGGMGLENEPRPILRCDSRKTLQAQRLGVWPVKGITERLLQLSDFRKLGSLGVSVGIAQEPRHMAPEIPRAPPVGGVRFDIGAGELSEGRVAEIRI